MTARGATNTRHAPGTGSALGQPWPPRQRPTNRGSPQRASCTTWPAPADPNVGLVAIGDFNAYEFTDGYVDAVGQIASDFDPADNHRVSSILSTRFLRTVVADRSKRALRGSACRAPAYNAVMSSATDGGRTTGVERLLAERLIEAERLFRDFRELTPYEFTPFVRMFDSFVDYERWKHAQANPWYR